METNLNIITQNGSYNETAQKNSNMNYPSFMFSSYPDMLTVHQVMSALNVSEYTARSLIRNGELESKLIRGSYRVPKSSIFEYTYSTKHKADEQPTLYLLRRVC